MGKLAQMLFPEPVRVIPHARLWNILLRTAHLAVTGIYLGGHFFKVAQDRLHGVLLLCLATGLGLVVLEAYPSCRWLYQGRGLMALGKVALLGAIPFFWEQRVTLLLAIVVLGSVGSHMPSRFRYFSVAHGCVVGGRKEESLSARQEESDDRQHTACFQ